MLSKEQIKALLAETIGFDGELQTVNQGDLERVVQAAEGEILKDLRRGVDFPKLPEGVGYLSLQIAAEVARLIKDYGDRRAIAERERICTAIKAEDDYCVTEGDYMLDSDDCIKVARGSWVRPDYDLSKAKPL